MIQQFYPSLPKDKILLKLSNRTWPSVQRQAWALGIHKYNIIKKNKDDFTISGKPR